MKRYIILLLLSVINICTHATIPSDSIRVSIVTTGPGSEIWQLEGHAALRVQIGESVDMAVNYGIFDFKAPYFVYRFVKGETDYRCEAYPFPYFVNEYVTAGRWIHEYPITLEREEAEALLAYLGENLQPQNAVYRYNYVKDNCATRPVEMIERALGDTIKFPYNPLPGAISFRDIMRHYHRNYPWYQFGIDLALGSGIDYPITKREKIFAPVVLDSMLTTAIRPDGRMLAPTMITLFPGASGDISSGQTPWYATPFAVAIYLLVISITISVHDIRKCQLTRWYDALFMTVTGLTGCVLFFLVFVSVHEATSPNWLLIWLNPAALLVPALIFIKKNLPLLFYYEIVNFVAILLLSAIWLLTGQSGNAAFIPLAACDAILSARYIYIYRQCEKKIRKK
ncbi:MAG: DUF4105 domain-containing protein [Muribaculum sp.]|nr:DUF4105 domain-containing protein [Muribaculum sp.]